MRAPRVNAEEQYRLIMKCRRSGLSDQVEQPKADYSGALWFFRNYPFLHFLTYLSFASSKRFLQRPYIVRFIIFNRLFVPSTKPLL